ncbi:MAG: hypothetical protein QOH64_1295, partial [Acidimicrobiaceae bacterium]
MFATRPKHLPRIVVGLLVLPVLLAVFNPVSGHAAGPRACVSVRSG